MKLKINISHHVKDELKQKKAITKCLINKILYSKRLLVEHVEALEHCLMYMEENPAYKDVVDTQNNNVGTVKDKQLAYDIFTARNTCALIGGTILEHFITPKYLRFTLLPTLLLTSGFTAMYMVKNVFVFRNKIVERELDNLIRTIDEFGNCIRRNMTYFNEIIIMKPEELIESRQIERAWDCITSTKEVTEILYDAIRKLEITYPIPTKFSQHYSPIEELRECEYFKNNVTDYSPKHIKDFHNIFAYIQSQFLLRLALTITTYPSISRLNAELVKIDCLIRQLVLEEENHFKNLSIELNKKKQQELETLNSTKCVKNRNEPIAVLQDSSLKLSACMVAVAGECQALDVTLQQLNATEAEKKDNAKQLLQVANNMHGIENALSVCFDDFQRLMLMYNKFLNSKLIDANNKSAIKSNVVADDEFPESILRVEISENDNEAAKTDDFYAYMYDEQQAKAEEKEEAAEKQKTNKNAQEMEILNFEKRITKGKFRPVLKQLKDRIDPIRESMLQKEREVLAAKGINVDQLLDNAGSTTTTTKTKRVTICDKPIENPAQQKYVNQGNRNDDNDADSEDSDSDSVGSADLEYERRKKILKEQDNYAEVRNFLAQKQAISLFKLDIATQLPTQAAGKEDILESEC